ncbi:MAG: PAS domain S-box protein [Bacteroidales bacterium]
MVPLFALAAKGITSLLAAMPLKGYPLMIIIGLILLLIGSLIVFWHQNLSQRRNRKHQKHYQGLMEAAPTAMLIFQDYRLKYVNKAMEQLTGYSAQELLSMEIWQLIHPQSLHDLNTEKWFSGETGKGMRVEFQIRNKNEEVIWVDFSARLIDFNNKPAFLGVALNINDKKQFEAKLIEAEERYSLILLATNDGISDYSLESDSLYLSLQWKEMLGYQEKDVADTLEAWIDLIHPEDHNKALKMFKKIREGEIPDLETEYRMRCKDGSYRWVQVKLSVVFDNQSKPVRVLGTHSDVTEKKKNEEILRESEYRYKSLFSQNSVVMLIINPDTGDIEDANASACSYYGYSQQELVSMNINDIDQTDSQDADRDNEEQSLQHYNGRHMRHRLKSGVIRDVEVYHSKIELQGRILNHSIIYDVTERKQMEVELKAAKEEAEVAVTAKSLFISSVSHEIRTPLNAIIGLADLMVNDENIPPAMEEYLRSIKFSSDHLLGIINDVLDFSKLEAGKLGVDFTGFNLRQLVKDSVNAVKFKADEKNLQLRVRLNENVPEMVHSDPSRLKQILLNLLSNSLKFTQEGHIDVYAKVLQTNGNKCRIRFAVSDTGIGIPEDKQENIFESFSQAEAHTFRKYGGTGLGLSICKKLTGLLDGSIGVKSIEGIGSTFWFEIPMEISDQPLTGEMEKDGTSMEDLSGLKILLVEDDNMNQFVMARILKKWKIDPDIANHGKEALQMLEKKPYDLVLMDVHMPEMDGYEATRAIRQGHARVLNPQVPVIALTADITPETRTLVNESGMNDYISKPCDHQELIQRIRKYCLAAEPKKKRTSSPTLSIGERQNARNHIRKALWDIFDDDLQATRSMIRHFIKQVPANVEQARQALEASQLEEACQYLHKVKPGFSYLGFPEVANRVEKIQQQIRTEEDPKSVALSMSTLEQEISKIISILQEVLMKLEPDASK